MASRSPAQEARSTAPQIPVAIAAIGPEIENHALTFRKKAYQFANKRASRPFRVGVEEESAADVRVDDVFLVPVA